MPHQAQPPPPQPLAVFDFRYNAQLLGIDAQTFRPKPNNNYAKAKTRSYRTLSNLDTQQTSPFSVRVHMGYTESPSCACCPQSTYFNMRSMQLFNYFQQVRARAPDRSKCRVYVEQIWRPFDELAKRFTTQH